MKRYIFILLVITLLLAVVGCAGGPEVGVMDMNRVLDESRRAAQLDDELSRIGDEFDSDEDEEDGENGENEENEENGENEEDELDSAYMEYQDSKRQLEGQLNEEVENVLQDLSEEYGLKIIVYKENIHHGGRDITDRVVEELDSRYYEAGDDTDE